MLKKGTAYVLKRAEYFQIILIFEGMLVGLIGGGIVVAYRLLLAKADQWLQIILEEAGTALWKTALWFTILIILAFVVGKLVQWEPMISGSGIPQLEGEMTGKLDQCWWKVLLAKFTGGFLSLLAGLSLGREGPSIQLGAMAGKGISRVLDRGKTEEKYLLTCGASAGLAAAFHAPLAGVMFSLEEVHKNFSVSVLVSVMASSITADFLCSRVVGLEPVFDFTLTQALPHRYYWMILILGLILGVFGAFYNKVMLVAGSLYRKITFLNTSGKLLIPFLLAGILGFTCPTLLGSGHNLVHLVTDGPMAVRIILFLLVGKFIFSAISFGSGAPGGIFFPLLVLGALVGGMFANVGVEFFQLDPTYINNFVLLAMAGLFTAIVRAPLTGIILIFEMTGSVDQMLSLAMISIMAYIVANLLKSAPIYESLLDNLLKRQGKEVKHTKKGQRILGEFVIMQGSCLVNKKISEITWPESCLLVTIIREGKEILPKGKTILNASDTIITLTDESGEARVIDEMTILCEEEHRQ